VAVTLAAVVVVAALLMRCHLSLVVGVAPGGVGDVKREGWLAEDCTESMHAWVIVAKQIPSMEHGMSHMCHANDAMPMMPCQCHAV
jgi:hypothetical protein